MVLPPHPVDDLVPAVAPEQEFVPELEAESDPVAAEAPGSIAEQTEDVEEPSVAEPLSEHAVLSRYLEATASEVLPEADAQVSHFVQEFETREFELEELAANGACTRAARA
jgi:hypothetical protein